MQNAMNQIFKEFIPETTIPFLDDIPIKEDKEKNKDETMEVKGCKKFVKRYIEDVAQILGRLELVNLMLSLEK